MESLLFLAHRLPYPPNKGDKVRSYHFLKHLAARFRVFLGTFVDDPDDWRHVDALRELCAEVHVEALVPWSRRAASTVNLLCGEALTLRYFGSWRLRRWVKDIAERERIALAFAFSSPMAQYALDLSGVRTFVDMVDMDSLKWAQYARRRPWPVSSIYSREARRLLQYERKVAAQSEASIFVTKEERRLFCDAAPECAARVVAIGNGVDSDYFQPSPAFGSPFDPNERPIVFTGAMDYWPNVDAVSWFAHDVLPEIRGRDARARFYIVGMNPTAAVKALASEPAVVVTGRVDDIRPYLQHARVVVAPLRVARGIQNKVLEAMAMAKPVVMTPAMAAGMSVLPGVEVEVASTASEFAAASLRMMDAGNGADARTRVLDDYSWSASYARLDELLDRDGEVPLAARRAPFGGVPCTLGAD